MEYLSTLILAILVTSLTVPLLRHLALHFNLVDLPNERKVHTQPIPRVGGVGMALGACLPLLFWGWDNSFIHAYLCAAAVLIVFGIADDLLDISPGWKLVGQIAAACIVIYLGRVQIVTFGMLLPEGFLIPEWISLLLTLIAIVGVTNAINLADGLDGLAGGISLLCIATIGLLAWQGGEENLGLIAIALCGAIFGFLRYNTFPASVFMGDTGSQLLGFTAITIALSLTQKSTALSPVVPLLILGFPILDTVTVMCGRIAHKRSPFSADKNHFHHNLLELGLRQPESVLVIYMIQVSLIVLAYTLRFYSDLLLLGGYLIFSALVLTVFNVCRLYNWTLKRDASFDTPKVYMLWLRRHIKSIFRALCGLYPVLLVLTVLFSGRPSGQVAMTAALFLLLMVGIRLALPHRFEVMLKSLVYIIVPYGVFLTDEWIVGQPPFVEWGYESLFILLVLLCILVSKLTRRMVGFKSTPLDFLIICIVMMPLLPILDENSHRMGHVIARIIIMYYGCEVLIPELRGRYRVVTAGVAAALLLVLVRWFL